MISGPCPWTDRPAISSAAGTGTGKANRTDMGTRDGHPNHSDHQNNPGRLAQVLAELHARLRLSPSGSGRPPAALDRLLVTATLLPELSARDVGFVPLARSLDRLMAAVEADPSLWPDHLDHSLDSLADFLESVLAASDEGAATLGEEDEWRHQENLWSASSGPDGTTGDGGDCPGPRPIAGGMVIVAVDGDLRREQVRDRVRAAGFEAVPAEVDDVLGLAEEAGAVGILADDLEPGRNLARLAVEADPAGRRCPLILLSAGKCDPVVEADRARRSGANGAWCEPWDPIVLVRILQYPSHP
jgi:hypothetical protein